MGLKVCGPASNTSQASFNLATRRNERRVGMEVKKRQLILVHVISGGYRSDYHIFDLEAGKVLKSGIQSSLNPGGDGDVVVSETSIILVV